jgi:DNA-binding NarL/FixJ family response regulator
MKERSMRILILDDVRLNREAIADQLGQRGCAEVVMLAGTVAEALAVAVEVPLDIVLLSAAMPDAAATVRALRQARGSIRVLALGVPERGDDVLPLADAGAAGYVAKTMSIDELEAAIAAVARDEMPCPPWIAAALGRRLAALAAEHDHASSAPQALTRREEEVAQLVMEGFSNKEIARRLSIQVRTVKNHVHHILEKVHARRRSELAIRLHALLPVGIALPTLLPGREGRSSRSG